jgi:hypothetical protein
MQNPLTGYRSSLYATHNNIDESLAYLNSMMATLSNDNRAGINIAVHCLINTLSDIIDNVYHPTKNMSIASLIDKHLDDVLAQRVEEIVNDRISDAIGEYMSNEFDISDYEDNIDWSYRIESNLDNDMIKESVEEIVKNSLTIEVRVS